MSSTEIKTSSEGSLRIISKNTFALTATEPSSLISPSINVSIPISRSFAINLIYPSFTSITRHSKMVIVDLLGMAFKTIFIPSISFDLSQIMFM